MKFPCLKLEIMIFSSRLGLLASATLTIKFGREYTNLQHLLYLPMSL